MMLLVLTLVLAVVVVPLSCSFFLIDSIVSFRFVSFRRIEMVFFLLKLSFLFNIDPASPSDCACELPLVVVVEQITHFTVKSRDVGREESTAVVVVE